MASPSLQQWILFTRPRTLIAAIAPTLIGGMWGLLGSRGNAAAYDGIQGALLRLVIFLIAAVFLQVACNFVNDYYDSQRSSDSRENRLGPKRLLQQGQVSRKQVKQAIFFLYVFVFLLSIVLSLLSSAWLLGVALFSMFVSFAYSGGKFPLAYIGLGEIAAFLFFGPIITLCSFYLAGLSFKGFFQEAFLSSLVCGSFAWLLMSMNNLRDIAADKKSARRNFVQTFGRSFTLATVILCFLIVVAMPFWLGLYYNSILFYFTSAASLFLIIKRFKRIFTIQNEEFNALLSQVGMLYTLYAAMFCLSLLFL